MSLTSIGSVLLALTLSFSILGCVTTQKDVNLQPDWINTSREEDGKIFVVASAETFDMAKKLGQAKLAGTLADRASIIAKNWFLTNQDKLKNLGSGGDLYIQKLGFTIRESLEKDSFIVDEWFDKNNNLHYILIEISISDVIRRVREVNDSVKQGEIKGFEGKEYLLDDLEKELEKM